MYIMSETFSKRENTKIRAELNNTYKNFKIASTNLSQKNARAVDNRISRNFENITTVTQAIVKLQHNFSDAISR